MGLAFVCVSGQGSGSGSGSGSGWRVWVRTRVVPSASKIGSWPKGVTPEACNKPGKNPLIFYWLLKFLQLFYYLLVFATFNQPASQTDRRERETEEEPRERKRPRQAACARERCKRLRRHRER